MRERFLRFADQIIIYSFYLLFLLVPLVLTPLNYELFEYNKMMTTYAFTVIISTAWIIKMIAKKEMRIAPTPLFLPLVLFLLSQIISTILSVDRHLSIWGYYSRFNGGLFSVVSYFLLYYAFVTNFPKEKIKKLLIIVLTSGFLVAIYGILEHFGIDRDLWVQDVQNRVFSTLGQPNWLAAYLAVLIPLALSLTINSNLFRASDFGFRISENIGLLGYWVIGSIFYLTLLFTKSRSGFIGFWISLIIFCLIYLFSTYLLKKQSSKTPQIRAIAQIYGVNTKLIWLWIFCFVLITFFLGTPFAQINRFTYSELFKKTQQPTTDNASTPLSANPQPIKPLGSSIIDVGITESGTIRRIVWQGAIDIFKHYPTFGTGVETFALAYYKFRPVEHNMTSEWDFLYNKAHNEYLNYAATTGTFGLGSYLLIIVGFIWWNIKKLKLKSEKLFALCTLHFALFSSWFSILITNFFGFSVVLIQLFFFLIPAISFVLSDQTIPFVLFSFQPKPVNRNNVTMKQPASPAGRYNNGAINIYQKLLILFSLLFIVYCLLFIVRLWYADTIFATGYHLSHGSEPDYLTSYKTFKRAISLNNSEPLYYDELSIPAAMLSVALSDEKFSTPSSALRDEAILSSNIAVTISPNNVNYWKTRTRMFYTLAQVDEKYLEDAKESLIKAADLSPTDPKVSYNLALIYDRLGERDKAISLLLQTVKLKQDYKETYLALGLLYQQDKQKEKAKEAFNFILSRIDSNDEIAKKKMEELK